VSENFSRKSIDGKGIFTFKLSAEQSCILSSFFMQTDVFDE